MVELKIHGLWWKSPMDGGTQILLANERYNGFNHEEAQEIFPQIEEVARHSFRRHSYCHTQIQCSGEEFYVCVSDAAVDLPRTSEGRTIRTLDTSQIPGFKPKPIHWRDL
jgi:hypothetical protein